MNTRPRPWRAAALALAAVAALAGCREAELGPATLDPRNDTCRFCRMSVGDMRFAVQIVAPGEEPVYFDDLGCLTHYVKGEGLPPGAVVYVADHAARTWVRADQAVFTRVEGLDTPMGSGLIAHRDAAARDADPVTRQGQAVAYADIVPVSSAGGGASR